MHSWPIARTRRAALVLGVTCAMVAVPAASSPAIVPPSDCGRMTVKSKRYTIKADQMRCVTARSHAKRYLSKHQRPSGYSLPRLRSRDEAEVPLLARGQGVLRHPPLTLRASCVAARAWTATAALLVAAAALPAPALAHGLIQRANLPLPEWLFAWAAAVVLVVSFVALAVLWPQPRLEHAGWRPLPGRLGALLGSRVVEVAAGALGVALLALVIVAGFAGSQNALSNFAPTFVFITFWVGVAFASALFGDVFRALNPWRALGRAGG